MTTATAPAPQGLISSVKTSPEVAPAIVVYGLAGLGKTTFLCDAVNSKPDTSILFECGETRIGDLGLGDTPHFPHVLGMGNSQQELIDGWHFFKESVMKSLMLENHGKTVVVFDNFDNLINNNLDAFITASVYNNDLKKANGYGGAKVNEMFTELSTIIQGFKYLQRKGITVIVSTHGNPVNFRDPEAEDYKRWSLNLPAKTDYNLRNLVIDWSSITLFGTIEVEVENKKATGNRRVLKTLTSPAFDAKWGVGNGIKKWNPETIDFSFEAFKKSYTKAKEKKQ